MSCAIENLNYHGDISERTIPTIMVVDIDTDSK